MTSDGMDSGECGNVGREDRLRFGICNFKKFHCMKSTGCQRDRELFWGVREMVVFQ